MSTVQQTATEDSFDWNDDMRGDFESAGLESLVVYSRDWTVETIVNQIQQGNIDLNPRFQRRNAWTDKKRSLLIESLLVGMPVPEIVLAEDSTKRRSFLVLDGKQRLLTVAGFVDPSLDYWVNPSLRFFTHLKHLAGLTYDDLKTEPEHSDRLRDFLNADIRCTVISNYEDTDVLYDIFYRLNSGSVPLSSQELRQALNKGPFADYLIEITNTPQPIHEFLGLSGPDTRLRDIEILLRFFAFQLFANGYRGNLKRFLDDSMGKVTKDWQGYEAEVKRLYDEFNATATLIKSAYGAAKQVGRKYANGKWLRFNKALFEVELYYFHYLHKSGVRNIDKTTRDAFLARFYSLCETDEDFLRSIETTTKSLTNYQTRFDGMQAITQDVFEVELPRLTFAPTE